MITYERLLRLRRDLWNDFERRLATARTSPRALSFRDVETLALQYRQVLHDHALASARFEGTEAARHLRVLAVEGTRWLRRGEATGASSPLRFFSHTFPRAFRRCLPELGVLLALFATAAVLGLFLAVARPGLGTSFLGPSAIEGLKEGRLWTDTLLSTTPPAWSTSAIATNNMSVAIAAFAGGALAGLGAFYVVLLNGFMLGAIVGVTLHYEMTGRLLEFVAAHGPLEVTLVLTTAGAGLATGRAIIAATDRPRRDVVREAGRDATIVLLGCLPWFLLLGAVESFLSPSPALPPSLKSALGVLLLAVFLLLALRTPSDREAP